jgi:MFS family permease
VSHRAGTILLAIGAGLALADGSIVVLALPELLGELDTTVEGVAAVIGVYTAVLAVALPAAEWLRRRIGARRLGAAGLVLFALASLGAGLSSTLPLMLVLRGAQALGGAAALVAAFVLLDAGGRRGGGGRLWALAAIVGAAAGPALGGALTQALDWRAIFLAQVPLALAGALAAATVPAAHLAHPEPAPPRLADAPRRRAEAALALVSAALTAVLFLLVLILVAGWGFEPLAGAATVSILPLAALATLRVEGDPTVRAAVGCLLVAGGVAALAAVGTASAWWTVAPQLLAGAGMGLALPALGGALLPERTARDAAWVLTLRHAGIALALALLAPVIAAQLDDAVRDARERGTALVLDARLDPLDKVELAPALVADVDTSDARGQLQRALDAAADDLAGPEEEAEFARLRERIDDVVTQAVGDGFRIAFVATAAFALLAALALAPGLGLGGERRRALLAGSVVLALAVPLGTWAAQEVSKPEPVVIADPCEPRELPEAGGLGGLVQDAVLVSLDRAACRFGSSREELVLALADEELAREYEAEHGVDPRSAVGLLRGVLGF